jgi:CheY-like chemotaxis protein
MATDLTVLIVDDDTDVLEIATTLFEDIGLTVLRAERGERALDILREHPTIELLFTDISMPGMTGWELAHIAKQMRPELKVLYTSGYTKQLPFGQHGLGHGPLLPKPWRPDQLREKVTQVLGPIRHRPA